MLEIELKSGMASAYFVTDAKKGIAVLSNPRTIISEKTLSVKLLAEIFEKSFNASMGKSLLGALIKKADAGNIADFLIELADKQKSSKGPVLGISPKLPAAFIISKGIEKSCLVAMKVLKIRGYGQPLAVNISSEKADDQLSKLQNELKNELLCEDASFVVYNPKRLHVVSNRDKTIISTEKSVKEILNTRHELAIGSHNQEVRDTQAFIDEGIYN